MPKRKLKRAVFLAVVSIACLVLLEQMLLSWTDDLPIFNPSLYSGVDLLWVKLQTINHELDIIRNRSLTLITGSTGNV